jgi:deoxyribose-phosphate aldolase
VHRARLAAAIDHTLLDPLADVGGVERLCAEAVEWGIAHVCVSPSRVALAAKSLVGSPVGVCSVVGFPSGAHTSAMKAAEALQALADGATEIDMVANLGAIVDGDWGVLTTEVAGIVAAVGDSTRVKVILEAAAIGPERLVQAVRVAVDAGAGWVKTSTGYHPAGGATVADVAAMVAAAAGRARVKASGGIRSYADAVTMLEAGAERLGTSRGVDIVRDAPPS